MSDKHLKYLFFGLIAAALVIGVVQALSLWYVNDDCYVSFRAAKNLVQGHGLVYNPEERVEAHTNFLWTIIIAAGIKLNFDPVTYSNTLGIIFYLLTLVLYGYVSWLRRDNSGKNLLFIPLTTIALAVHRDFSAHATSGMETSMYAFLISAGFVVMLLNRRNSGYLFAGSIFVLAMMTRPDGIIFLAASVVYLAIMKKDFLKNVILLMTPSALIFLPYWIWRYDYYGFFFPNSFYAKSISLPYFSQGFEYTSLYFSTYYVFAAIPIFGLVLYWINRGKIRKLGLIKTLWNRATHQPGEPRLFLLASLFILPYTFFIIRIGGDFMFARFFIVLTPVLFFLIENLIAKVETGKSFIPIKLLIILFTILRLDQFKNDLFVGYIADESRYFSSEALTDAKVQGEMMKRYFNGSKVRLAFWAGQLKLIYYIDPWYAVEVSSGITDTAIAHQSIYERGRPGHEKRPTADYTVKRRINFYIGPLNPLPPGKLVVNMIKFNDLLARIITYDDVLMSKLKKYPEIEFVEFPKYVDEYISEMPSKPRGKVEEDYLFFRTFYFDHNSDSARESVFKKYMSVD